jgi:hypothetical protein
LAGRSAFFPANFTLQSNTGGKKNNHTGIFMSEIINTPIADLWIDQDEIIHVVSKKGPRNIELVREFFDEIQKLTGDKKTAAVFDITNTSPYNADTLAYLQRRLCRSFSAVAFVTRSPIGQLIGSFIECAKVPVKTFDTTEEALEWALKQKSP